MTYVPPTKWIEVPGAVRAALLEPFEKNAEDENGLPVIKHLADLAGWQVDGPISAHYGGPRPVASTIIGAGLGALGGYGTGRLAEMILPKKYFDEGAVRRRAAALGAALGAAPGLWQASQNIRESGGNPEAVFDKWPLKTGTDKLYEKVADDLFAPVIDRDRFNQQVLGFDGTPMPIRAATAGLVEAASATSGSSWVSPWDVAKIAVGAGAGLVSGIIAGKALGLLAGLSPAGQEGVMRTGLWTGLLSSVVPRALGLNR